MADMTVDEFIKLFDAFVAGDQPQSVETVPDLDPKVTPSRKFYSGLVKDAKRRIKATFPYHLRATAHFLATPNNSDIQENVSRRERLSVPINNRAEYREYFKGLEKRIYEYTFVTAHSKLRLTAIDFDVTDRKQKQKLVRVAKFEAENCVVNILRGYLGDAKVDGVYAKFPEITPVDNKPVYIDGDMLTKIAKATNVNILTYTPIGVHTNKPWESFGMLKKRKIHVQIHDEHATVMTGKLPITDIVYHNHIDTIPSTTNIVDADCWEPTHPTHPMMPKFYTELVDGKLIMHKCLRPSTISGDELHDTDPNFAYMFSIEQVLYCLFKSKFGLKTIPDANIRNIVKYAEHFIGRRVLSPLVGSLTEFDQNRNYMSYMSCAYYRGFPTNTLIPVAEENSHNPAFYVIRNIEDYPRSFAYYRNYLGGPIVLIAPEVDYLRSVGAVVHVDYVLDGTFKDISVEDFANSYELPAAPGRNPQKDFVNHVIGRTITGGIRETKVVKCFYSGEVERDQMISECQDAGYRFADNERYLAVEMSTKPKGLFNFHSYILGYAAIHMMTKWAELEDRGCTVVAYNVDAIVVEGDHVENIPGVGGWKTSKPKEYYHVSEVSDVIEPIPVVLPVINVVNRAIPLRDTAFLGAAGISKSYPWVTDPVHGQIILTPTRELAREHRADTPFRKGFANTFTAAKYFQFTIAKPIFASMRATGKIPPAHPVVVIDEAGMFTQDQWKRMIVQCAQDNSLLITLGDFEQIKNARDDEPISAEFLERFGISTEYIPRTPEKVCRHQYEFGCWLDTLRGKSIDEQKAIILASDLRREAKPTFAPQSRVIVGTHEAARIINAEAKYACGEGLFPFRTLAKDSKIVYLPTNTPNVFWNRRSMTSVVPPKSKYEPAFAVTADSFQGKTVEDADTLYIDVDTLDRQGTLYTAVTRTRSAVNIVILAEPIV